jgi:membrane protein implicated in regulation of membrane protease activity
MVLWQLLAISGIAFLILEMFTPSMFFLNFALAAFITAVLSLYTVNSSVLVISFFVFSFVSFFFLRPVIMKKFSKSQETGINSKYIDKIAKAETEITASSGVISIYGERWEARSEDNTVISQGSEVKIIRNESIIMYVSEITK